MTQQNQNDYHCSANWLCISKLSGRFPCTPLASYSILAALFLASCASRPINEPITQVDPKSGYRPYLLIPKRQHNDLSTLFVLSFSGGGARAAAFSYGVLQELKRTEIVVNGQHRRMIDEVDVITGVSGGSFTALAYAPVGLLLDKIL